MWENSPAKIKTVYDKLVALHGKRPHEPRRSPVRELISTILSQRTTHADEELAYGMMKRYGSWEAVRDAPSPELAFEVRSSRYPETKAENIKRVLAKIIAERGEADITFLADLPTNEALEWLTALPGVGLKTASLVLLFNFEKPVLPVDTHVHRISLRVALLAPKTTANKAHTLLLEQLAKDPYTLYNFPIALLRHGQRICRYSSPQCHACPLTAICNDYQDRHQHSV